MYDGNQVLRFENKFKSSDLVGLGKELTERKGTGNYDKERTKLNVSYVPLNSPTLQSKVYSTLNKNNIYYNTGKNVNLLNGAIITSGPEFFQSLGMKFKESDRVYQVGKKKGRPVLVPDIKTSNDIPDKVKNFFDEGYTFLEQLVGKENIVYAEVHYDEDTPHMHFYFLPVVTEVRRKVFETNSNGTIIKHEVVGKDGITKLVPIQKKDENGKIMYTTEKGKFLNCDQFWKDKGGKTSFAKIQDDYNKYITEKGFNLYRGNIGDNVQHKTKAQQEIDELNAQINDIKQTISKNQKLNEVELETLNDLKSIYENEILNPVKRKIIGYNENDVEELINYSKQIKKENTQDKSNLKKKDIQIEDLTTTIKKLTTENNKLKDGRAIKERDTKIYEQELKIQNQKKLIKEKDSLIDTLQKQINNLQEKFNNFKEKMFNFCDKLCKALAHKLGVHDLKEEEIDYDEFEYHATQINKKYDKDKDKSDDFDLGL